MFKIKVILALMTINSLFTLKALSQTEIVTIASILDSPSQGKEVTLRGKIIDRQPGEEDYIFTDGTNKIVIELQDNNFAYDSETTVEISGIVNFESKHIEEQTEDLTPENLEIEVSQLRVINLDN